MSTSHYEPLTTVQQQQQMMMIGSTNGYHLPPHQNGAISGTTGGYGPPTATGLTINMR
jgi:hypothetical protein